VELYPHPVAAEVMAGLQPTMIEETRCIHVCWLFVLVFLSLLLLLRLLLLLLLLLLPPLKRCHRHMYCSWQPTSVQAPQHTC
jgi:hypothetical protein